MPILKGSWPAEEKAQGHKEGISEFGSGNAEFGKKERGAMEFGSGTRRRPKVRDFRLRQDFDATRWRGKMRKSEIIQVRF